MKQVVDKVITPNWRDVFKRWSFWLATAGTAVTTFTLAAPDTVLQMWIILPQDLKSALPVEFVRYFGIGLFIASNVAALIKQRKVKA